MTHLHLVRHYCTRAKLGTYLLHDGAVKVTQANVLDLPFTLQVFQVMQRLEVARIAIILPVELLPVPERLKSARETPTHASSPEADRHAVNAYGLVDHPPRPRQALSSDLLSGKHTISWRRRSAGGLTTFPGIHPVSVISSRPCGVVDNVQRGLPQDRSGPLIVGEDDDQEHPQSVSCFKHTLGTRRGHRRSWVSSQSLSPQGAVSRRVLTISKARNDYFNHSRVRN